MSTASLIYTGRLVGQTSAGVAITTVNPVTFHSDGMLRWTDANGRPRSARLSGDLALLFRTAFTGTNGITHALQTGVAAT
jgi:hypothetical protein